MIEGRGLLAPALRGGTGEDGAQHPPGAVDGGDAGDHVRPLDADGQPHLHAEGAGMFARGGIRGEQVGPHVVPQAHGLGSGEGLDLQARRAVGDGASHHLLRGAVRLDAQFDVLHEGQHIGAEIEVLVVRRGLIVADIPRSVLVAAMLVVGAGGLGERRLVDDVGLGARVGRAGLLVMGLSGDGVLAILGVLTVLPAESEQSHGSYFLT